MDQVRTRLRLAASVLLVGAVAITAALVVARPRGDGDDRGFAELAGGHGLEDAPDRPLTPGEQQTLARQLAATRSLADRYPTLGDAEDAGWVRAGPFSPGLGVHYVSRDVVADAPPASSRPLDPADMPTPMLVYGGLAADARLAGFLFVAAGTGVEPEGFAGPNDRWRYHTSLCVTFEGGALHAPFGADQPGVTEEMCNELGGWWADTTGYMLHVWNAPGYESPDGPFSPLNRRITCPDGTYHRVALGDLEAGPTLCRTG